MVVKRKNRSCGNDSQGVRAAGRRKGLKRRKMSRKIQGASELQRIMAGTSHSRKILDNAENVCSARQEVWAQCRLYLTRS